AQNRPRCMRKGLASRRLAAAMPPPAEATACFQGTWFLEPAAPNGIEGDGAMKKGIHPNYHFVEVRLNDGSTYKTRTTWGESGQPLTLDIDPTTHPAWTGGQQQLMDRGGRLTRFNKKFAGIIKSEARSLGFFVCV